MLQKSVLIYKPRSVTNQKGNCLKNNIFVENSASVSESETVRETDRKRGGETDRNRHRQRGRQREIERTLHKTPSSKKFGNISEYHIRHYISGCVLCTVYQSVYHIVYYVLMYVFYRILHIEMCIES